MTHTDPTAWQKALEAIQALKEHWRTLKPEHVEEWLDQALNALQVAPASEDDELKKTLEIRHLLNANGVLDEQVGPEKRLLSGLLYDYFYCTPPPPADVSEDERAKALDAMERAESLLSEGKLNLTHCKLLLAVHGKYIRKRLTRAKSDERVVSREDAKSALDDMNEIREAIRNSATGGDILEMCDHLYATHEETIRALLIHHTGAG